MFLVENYKKAFKALFSLDDMRLRDMHSSNTFIQTDNTLKCTDDLTRLINDREYRARA